MCKKIRRKVVVIVIGLLLWQSTVSLAVVTRKFDFGRQQDIPASGYIHVDSTNSYAYDNSTGLTYGIVGNDTVTEDYWGGWWSRNTDDELTLNGIRIANPNGQFLTSFELEVPNGTCTVTMCAGKVGWNCIGKLWMEEECYSGTVNSDNLYVLDVVPNNDDGYLTSTLTKDFEKHAPMYYGQLSTWGVYNNNPYWDYAECLYLQDQQINVTDGKLTVYGMGIENYFVLNYLEVTYDGFDVADYGAIAGSEAAASNNVTAFANAIAAAGEGDIIYVPAGTYYLNDAVHISRNGLILEGYGATLKRVSTGTSGMNVIQFASGVSDCVIKGLTIDGNRSANEDYSYGIYQMYCNRLAIKDCTIKNNGWDGVLIAGNVRGTTIDGCTITDNHRQGIAIVGSGYGTVINNCYFEDNALEGVDIEPEMTAGHIAVTDSVFVGDNDLYLYGPVSNGGYSPWNVRVQDCTFNGEAGINCFRAMNVEIIHNDFNGGSIDFNGRYANNPQCKGKVTLEDNSFDGIGSSSTNLLSNGNFENWSGGAAVGWSNWGTGTYTIESNDSRELAGSKALHICTTNGAARVYQEVAITAGEYYTFGGYVSGTLISGNSHPVMNLRFVNNSDTILKEIDLYSSYYEYEKYELYEKIMAIAEAPAGATKLQLRIGITAVGSGEAYYDELFLTEGISESNDLTDSKDKVWRFDFGPEGFYPRPSYIHVGPETTYGYYAIEDANYGVFNNTVSQNISADDWSHSWNSHTSTDLVLTGLRFPDESPWWTSGFEMQVPNGDYYVTVGGGKVNWDAYGKLRVENNYYSGSVNNANLYVVDVIPDNDDGVLNWTEIKDYDMHQSVGPYGEIKTWGTMVDHPYFNYAEILYLKDEVITVTDGKLTVFGFNDSDGKSYLNFLEVVRKPNSLPAPGAASNPTPANAATGVNVTPTLSWTAGSGTASHDVYFGTNQTNVTNATHASAEYKGNQAGITYAPGTLTNGTIYYWRIDEVGSGGTTKGAIWSFTTITTPPTFVAAGAITANAAAITPALPGSLATNDILLLFVETANEAITISTPNGGTWTQVTYQGTGTAGSTTATRLTIFWSRYNGTQGAPTTSDAGNHQIGRIIAIRGATTSGNPWDVTVGGIETTSDTSGSIPGATTTVPNTLVVAAVAGSLPDAIATANFASWTNANLTTLTERVDNTQDAGNGGAIGVVTGVKATAGAYGNTTVTHTAAAIKGMISIAMKP